jgi:hypothetical protein
MQTTVPAFLNLIGMKDTASSFEFVRNRIGKLTSRVSTDSERHVVYEYKHDGFIILLKDGVITEVLINFIGIDGYSPAELHPDEPYIRGHGKDDIVAVMGTPVQFGAGRGPQGTPGSDSWMTYDMLRAHVTLYFDKADKVERIVIRRKEFTAVDMGQVVAAIE